jgi:hypothetical protein
MKKLLVLLVLGTGVAVAAQWPEIQRYIKISRM